MFAIITLKLAFFTLCIKLVFLLSVAAVFFSFFVISFSFSYCLSFFTYTHAHTNNQLFSYDASVYLLSLIFCYLHHYSLLCCHQIKKEDNVGPRKMMSSVKLDFDHHSKEILRRRTVNISQGDALMHEGHGIYHGVTTITKGTRFVLILFYDVVWHLKCNVKVASESVWILWREFAHD